MNNLDQSPSIIFPLRKKKQGVISAVINHRRLTDIYKNAKEEMFIKNTYKRKKD